MLRNSRQHLLASWHRVSKTGQASNLKRWLGAEAKPLPSTRASSSSGRQAAGYITAGTTVGFITCYRSDSAIDHDPYNILGLVVAVLAHNAVNRTPNFSWPLLFGSLAIGEFLGNGFRHIHQQYSGITITEEERHQLLDDVAEIASHEKTPMSNNKDLLEIVENGVSAILLQAKTRWVHLCHHIHPPHNNKQQNPNVRRRTTGQHILLDRRPTGQLEGEHHHHHGSVPDHLSMEELKTAILDMEHKEGEDEQTKEALLQVLAVADINGDGVITFLEFSRALLLLELAKKNIGSAKSELYFRAIDLHHHGSIDQEELLHFAKRLHALGGIPHNDRTTPHWSGLYERPSTPEEICAKWMNRFDLNHDGKITKDEFDKMAKEIDFGPSFLFAKYFDRTPE